MGEPEQPRDYFVFPEEAIKFLPEEWQQHFHALIDEGQAVLEIADDNLRNLNRLVHALPSMASLRYIQHRLASTKFEATMDWVLENDMLTLAFVTTYVRLIDGGIGSGVSRSALPPELRPVHDNIIRHAPDLPCQPKGMVPVSSTTQTAVSFMDTSSPTKCFIFSSILMKAVA